MKIYYEHYFNDVKGLDEVRINKRARCIVFSFSQSVKPAIEEKLQSMDLESLLTQSQNEAVCINCKDEGKPSLNGLLKSWRSIGCRTIYSKYECKSSYYNSSLMFL